MATLVVCDVCGEPGRNKFEYYCHLEMTTLGYVDMEWNPVSGRTVEKDLCNKCYNEIVSLSVNELLRRTNGKS